MAEVSAFEMYKKAKNGSSKKKRQNAKKSIVDEKIRLEEEYNLIKKITQAAKPIQNETKKTKSLKNKSEKSKKKGKNLDQHKKKTNKEKQSASSESSDSESKKNNGVTNSGESTPHEELDGDDVPLVEEALVGMLEDDDSQEPIQNGTGVNGENFMTIVMKSNEQKGTFAQNLREKFVNLENGKVNKKETTPNKKKRKFENGLGTVSVDEEKVPKKKLKTEPKTKISSDPGSVQDGEKLFEWMIQPTTSKKFFDEIWEKKPFHIKRGSTQPQYYKHIFSTKAFDEILRSQNVQFTKNLDVTSYTDGKRETHNPEGRAYGPVVWDFYNNGCSLRMLNPQTFDDHVWKLCATLQDFFGSFVGTNMYLTPPGTQGFAPHYDDVEVFILQLEGKKHWRLYEPRKPEETLPRFSSRNFNQDEIGEPIMDITLQPGDLLYMPRGTIHQGNCLEDIHSLHITVSCHQLNSYGDLLEKMLPAALKCAMEEDIEFRRGLPVNYLNHLGIAHSEENTKPRQEFIQKIGSLMNKLMKYANIDGAVDQMGKQFIHNALPPYLTSKESSRTVITGGERWNSSKSRVVNRVELDPDTEIRLVRAHCLRLVTDEPQDGADEDGAIRIYHCVENTREYQEIDPQFMEVDSETAPAIEALIQKYPDFMKVEDLPIEELDTKMKVVQDLWEKKLLLTKEPLEAHYDD